jgi:hypothetical protein
VKSSFNRISHHGGTEHTEKKHSGFLSTDQGIIGASVLSRWSIAQSATCEYFVQIGQSDNSQAFSSWSPCLRGEKCELRRRKKSVFSRSRIET